MKKITLLLTLLCSIVSAEIFDVSISNNKFTPNDLTIQVGDTVRWTNTQGFHDVVEDNNVFSSGPPSSSAFVFERTFNSIEEVLYHCSVHSLPGLDIDTNMNGRIVVQGGTGETFDINQGIAGAWFFPDTSGSGILFDIRPSDKFIFAAWFTYDLESPDQEANNSGSSSIGSVDNRWFTASGNYEADSAIEIDLFHTFGGIFDNDQNVTSVKIGTISFVFDGCSAGNVSYNITEGNLTGDFPIQRVIGGTESLCEDLIVTEESEE